MNTSPIREAVAAFDDPEELETAVSELQSHGIDRANLSLLADASLVDRSSLNNPEDLAEDRATPREAAVTDTDMRQERVLGTALAASIAALAAAGLTVATGGAAAITAAAAAAAAGGAGAIGTMVGRKLQKDEEAFLDAQLARGGVLLWVRTVDANAERRALDVLRRHSSHVHLHSMPTEPTPGQEEGR